MKFKWNPGPNWLAFIATALFWYVGRITLDAAIVITILVIVIPVALILLNPEEWTAAKEFQKQLIESGQKREKERIKSILQDSVELRRKK